MGILVYEVGTPRFHRFLEATNDDLCVCHSRESRREKGVFHTIEPGGLFRNILFTAARPSRGYPKPEPLGFGKIREK